VGHSNSDTLLGMGCIVLILDEVASAENVSLIKYDVSVSQEGRNLFNDFNSGFGISQYSRGVPMVVVDCDSDGVGDSYLMGDTPIIDSLEESVTTCFSDGNLNHDVSPVDEDGGITFWGIIIAAAIDSVNPCAFGVLIFLMLSLLKMGSAKRALRAGLLYTFVVFVLGYSSTI